MADPDQVFKKGGGGGPTTPNLHKSFNFNRSKNSRGEGEGAIAPLDTYKICGQYNQPRFCYHLLIFSPQGLTNITFHNHNASIASRLTEEGNTNMT